MARVTRRTLLVGATGAAAAVGGLGVPLARAAAPPASAAAATGSPSAGSALAPVSMAMHLHGSFSEGVASMAAHLAQAQRLGVDVVWWTDHDFRVNGYGYRGSAGFDGLTDSTVNGVSWTWAEQREGGLRSASGTFVSEPHSPDEAGKALKLTAVADGDGGTLWYAANASNSMYRTNLADTTLELDVLAQQVSADAQLAIEILCSHHPATGGRAAGQYTLIYRVGGVTQASRSASGLVGTIRLPIATGSWKRLALRPVEDIAALWPDLNAGDNSLFGLRIGVRASRGAATTVVVDRLRLHRARRAGQEALALRHEIMRRNAERFPGIEQRSALEVSLTRHLNWFGGQVTLPDYGGRPPTKDTSIAAARAMTSFIHDHGGLASYNHPLEGTVSTPEALSKLMITEKALGCDIVEIGCPQSLTKLLHVLDVSARNAVFFTGTGVTDDHAGKDWLSVNPNYYTNVWAGSVADADLTAALRAGRAWFVNPKSWRGTLDVAVNGVSGMGGVLVTAAEKVPVTITASDLPTGSTVELVIGVVDYAGTASPTPSTKSQTKKAGELPGGTWNLEIWPSNGKYLRPMVRDAAGAIIGVGNPVWLLRAAPPHGIPTARRL